MRGTLRIDWLMRPVAVVPERRGARIRDRHGKPLTVPALALRRDDENVRRAKGL